MCYKPFIEQLLIVKFINLYNRLINGLLSILLFVNGDLSIN